MNLSEEEASIISNKVTSLAKFPCRIHCISIGLVEAVKSASSNLLKDGLKHDLITPEKDSDNMELVNENQLSPLMTALRLIEKLMEKLHHRLYRGEIYKHNEKGL